MTDPRYMAPRERHDELQNEIDQFLREEADLIRHARSVIQVIRTVAGYHHAIGNRAPLPSVSTLRRRLARSDVWQRTPDAMNRVRSRFAATSRSSAVRLLVEDPAKSFRRPHARPVLYVDPYTGAIFSAR